MGAENRCPFPEPFILFPPEACQGERLFGERILDRWLFNRWIDWRNL